MSWWGNGMKDGDPLVLEDCETPRTAEEYRRIAEESLEEVLRLENAPNWEPIPYADDRVSLAGLTLPDSPLKCVRTCTILPGSPQQVKAFMSCDDIAERKKWDTELIELRVVEEVGGIQVVFQAYKAPFGVTNRSFVATRSAKYLEDGTIVVGGTSVNHDECPYDSRYVRGKATSAIIYKPVPGDSNKCQMTRLVNVDPKGNIPAMAINMGIKKAGDATIRLIEVVEEASRRWERVKEQPALLPDALQVSAPISRVKPLAAPAPLDHEDSDSDAEHQFFETSSFFEMPDEVIDEKIQPLEQRLNFIERNAAQTTRKLESLSRQSKTTKSPVMRVVYFNQLSRLTQVLIILWPAVVIVLYRAYRKWRANRK